MAESQATLSALSATTLFSSLSPEELRLLAAHAVRKPVAAGQILFNEGDPCKGLHIVASGKVRIFKSSPGGRQQVLGTEGPGNSIAELPVFDGGPYPASVSAIDDAQILFISRDDFRAFCLQRPEVALKILAVVGSRLRHLVEIIEELSFSTIRQRLISILVKLALSHGKRTARGVELQLPGTHQELANQLGTVRELVSRNLMRLNAEGLLAVDGRHIVVRDLAALTAELDTAG
jgi:CRP/FNR family cyclic AMP-dependent transcriptional regulator